MDVEGEVLREEGYDLTANDGIPVVQPSRAKHRWKLVRERLKLGDFLVDQNSEFQKKRRSSLAKEKGDLIRKGISFSITQCLLAILAYEIVAILCFSLIFEPQWTIIDSCYFSVVTFTTVGYGDLIPTSPASRLFTAAYALCGVASLGVALGVIGSILMEKREQAEECKSELSKFQAMTLLDYSRQSSMSDISKTSAVDRLGGSKSEDLELITKGDTFWATSHMPRFIILFVSLLIVSFLMGFTSKWDFVTTFYFLLITMCTIGFGDYVPQTQTEKLIAVFMIPLACAIMGTWLALVAGYIMKKRSMTFRQHLSSKELTLEDIYVMDRNDDGIVTRADFFAFMLVSMGKVDQDTIHELDLMFDKLDVTDSGVLSKEGLVASARRKLNDSSRKAELAAYKAFLIEKMQIVEGT